MDAIPFKEQNMELAPPSDMPECMTLPIWRGEIAGEATMISKWKLTTAEIRQINETGILWLHVSGWAHPPVAIATDNPFK